MSRAVGKVAALWKQGWNEIPEVMGASIFGAIGIVGLLYAVYHFETTENKTKRYKLYYTIMRPDDKRVEKLWRFDNSPPFTSSASLPRQC